jgi:hypothetical protein
VAKEAGANQGNRVSKASKVNKEAGGSKVSKEVKEVCKKVNKASKEDGVSQVNNREAGVKSIDCMIKSLKY